MALRFEVSQVPKSEAPGAPSIEVNAGRPLHTRRVGNSGGEQPANRRQAKGGEERGVKPPQNENAPNPVKFHQSVETEWGFVVASNIRGCFFPRRENGPECGMHELRLCA